MFRVRQYKKDNKNGKNNLFSRLFYFVVVLLLFGLFGSRIRESSSLSFNFSVIQVLKSSRVAYTTATESLFLCRCPIDKTWIFTPTDRVRSYLAVWSKFLLKSLLADCLLRLERTPKKSIR